MPKKLKLEGFYSVEDVAIIGLNCTMPDYKAVWHLNNTKLFDFKKEEDFQFKPLRSAELLNFSFFVYDDEAHFTYYYFIANKNQGFYLINEFKQFDFFLMIKGSNIGIKEKEVQSLVKSIAKFTFVYLIDIEKIKDISLIINDLELRS